MRSIVIKEIKELRPFATVFVSAMVLQLFVIAYFLGPNVSHAWAGHANQIIFALLPAPFIAFIFACVQCFSEIETGGGSFLIQRPVSLYKVFWIKAVVGIGLTILVTGTPCLVEQIWHTLWGRPYVFPLPDQPLLVFSLGLCTIAWMSGTIWSLMLERKPLLVGFLPVCAIGCCLFLGNWELVFVPLYVGAAYGTFVSFGNLQKLNTLFAICLGILDGLGGTVTAACIILLPNALSMVFGGTTLWAMNLILLISTDASVRTDAILVLAAVNLLSALYLYFLSRRQEWSTRVSAAWIFGGLLAGPITAIAAFSLSDFPKKEPCPKCGKGRLVTKSRCLHCHAEWPLPPATGAEIFDPSAYAAGSVNLSSIPRYPKTVAPTESLLAKGRVSLLTSLLAREANLIPFALMWIAWGTIIASFQISHLQQLSENAQPLLLFRWVGYFGATLGGFLGWTQFVIDSKPGARDFAQQRPVSSSQQFFVRLLTGLLFYVVVVGVIVGGFSIYIATPGHIPGPLPEHDLALGLRDAALGMLYWFGVSILLTSTSVRRFGWKLAPILFCVGAATLAHDAASLPVYLAVTTLAYALIGAVAWSCFTGRGETARQPKIARFALGAMIAASLLFVVLAVQTRIVDTGDGYMWKSSNLQSLWRLPTTDYLPVISNDGDTNLCWYVDFNRHILLCYDSQSNDLVGIIDGNGWRTSAAIPNDAAPLSSALTKSWNWSEADILYHVPRNAASLSRGSEQNRYVLKINHRTVTVSSSEATGSEWASAAVAPTAGLVGTVSSLSIGTDGLLTVLLARPTTAVFEETGVVTLVALVLTSLLSIRLAWRRRIIIAWIVATLVLGVYAPVIIWALYPWPPRQACHHCGKKRIVTNFFCEHCGAPWPPPVLTGTEVFESDAYSEPPRDLVGK